MDEILIISSAIDGADLRRKQLSNPRHLRSAGRRGDAEIDEAILSKGRHWQLGAEAWERVFGGGL